MRSNNKLLVFTLKMRCRTHQDTPANSCRAHSTDLGPRAAVRAPPDSAAMGLIRCSLEPADVEARPNLLIRVTTVGAPVKYLIRGPRPERGTHESPSRHNRRRDPGLGRMWPRRVAASRTIHIGDSSGVVLCRRADPYRRGRQHPRSLHPVD